ncbi:hypothetical protein ACFVU2_03110 [Leifsonia sp. NPDC058194]|uniref:hypothetical protein n=1 Tax=Leifsonia sp. NPDC058194 TaxID=3346374 RepID=UPI0036DD3142
MGDKEHFVVTSNVDALFLRNGFDPDLVYTPRGDYGLFQCSTPCTRQVWDSTDVIARALAGYDPETGATSESAVPVCPNCGGAVQLNVNGGRWFVDDHFEFERESLRRWLQPAADNGENLVVLEIGSGFRTPEVIRRPLESIAAALPSSRLIRVSSGHPEVPAHLAARSASLNGDAAQVIAGFVGGMEEMQRAG